MVKVLFIAIGVLLNLNAILLLFVSNINIGLIATLCLGTIFMLIGIFWDKGMRKIPKWIKSVFFTGVAIVMLFIGFLLVYGNIDSVTYNEDVVIVLGCGVKGEEVGGSLKSRLDCAIDYYQKNSDVLIVVSGGQGPQEDITEALAMERYLLSKGIPQEAIIKEELSTNTYENFLYSKEILDNRFNETYTVAYITNDYHIYRAGAIAESVGYENVTHCSAPTPWYMMISSCLRECVGVMKFWVFKN